MGPASSKQLSELLLHWGNGDRKALEAILPLVYNELRRLARYHLQQQRANHTLQTTALVHEAYLKLAEEKSLNVKDRGHFLGIAAQLMRWILVDYERKRRAVKREAGATRLTLDPSVAARSQGQDVDLLALDEALATLHEPLKKAGSSDALFATLCVTALETEEARAPEPSLVLQLEAIGNRPEQAELRWGLGLVVLQQAPLLLSQHLAKTSPWR